MLLRKILFMFVLSLSLGRSYSQTLSKSKPWRDSLQVVPGKLECERYDTGGEGIAYHDNDAVNNGSGKLNPDDGSFYNTFRLKEAVDISYTKTGGIDDNPYNQVQPLINQLYVGWTEPGEWINYSVEVKEEGIYEGTLLYTANADGKIAMDLDGQSWMAPVLIKSTYNEKDTIAWRQWHHWNKQIIFSNLPLRAGKHVFTLRTIEKGNMNYDFIEFKKVR